MQLSTTWLDVITARQHFYKQQKIFILWIFNEFEGSDDFRKLTFSDIIYTNNSNAFIFNQEAYARSVAQKDLILKCYYREYYSNFDKVRSSWSSTFITLDQLYFDQSNAALYYFDSATSKIKAKEEVDTFLKQKKERERKEQLEYDKLVFQKQDLQEKLKNSRVNQEELNKELKAHLSEKKSLLEKLTSQRLKLENSDEEARLMYQRIDILNKHAVPPSILEDVLVHQNRYKTLITSLKGLKGELADREARLQNINKLETKTIGGECYQILDKVRDWEFIIQNHEDLYCFKLGQPVSLFSDPAIQRIVSFQLDQIQFNKTILILANFKSKIESHRARLEVLNKEIGENENDLFQLEHSFLSAINPRLRETYNESIVALETQIELAEAQASRCEQNLKEEDEMEKHYKTELQKYKYVYEDPFE